MQRLVKQGNRLYPSYIVATLHHEIIPGGHFYAVCLFLRYIAVYYDFKIIFRFSFSNLSHITNVIFLSRDIQFLSTFMKFFADRFLIFSFGLIFR